MIVLGFDTATPATAVALALADGEPLEARDDPPPGERPRHAAKLLPLADALLERAGIGWDRIERIAVGTGPGSFTGLRIGVATARALAQATRAELVGVSTLRALAAPAASDPPRAALAVLDALRGEAFAAAYLAGEPLEPARALSPEQLADWAAGLAARLGPDRAGQGAGDSDRPGGLTPRAVGDGAIRFRTTLEAAGIEVAPDDSPLHRVSGTSICRLAVDVVPAPLAAVVPEYVRPPDAELALRKRPR